MKYTDLIGNELKVGDFVAVAVANYGSGQLRRALITKIDHNPEYGKHGYYFVNLKTILIDNHYTRNKKTNKSKYEMGAHIGHTRRAQFIANNIEKLPSEVKIEVIKIEQNISKIFTPEELQYIGKTRIKLS